MTIKERNAKDLQKAWKKFLREQKDAKQSKPEEVQKDN